MLKNLFSYILVSILFFSGYNTDQKSFSKDSLNDQMMSSISINRIDISDCYFYDEKSYATVSVEFGWDNHLLGDSILVEVPGLFSKYAYTDLPIFNEKEELLTRIELSSPQVIAFELPADNSIQTVNLRFSTALDIQASSTFSLPNTCPFLFCGEDSTILSGLAFLDLNGDGIRQFGETSGFEGIKVLLFECGKFHDNSPSDSTYTDATGEYRFTGLNPGQEYKVFFQFPELTSMINTSGPGELNEMVQFPTVPDCSVNVSVSDLGLHCQRNPNVTFACYVHGDPKPGSKEDTDVLFSLPYNLSGNDTEGKVNLAVQSEAGSLWGIAWNAKEQCTYSSAMLRRHSAMGPLGLTGIYKVREGEAIEQWLDISFGGTYDFGTIPSNQERGLAIDPLDPSIDGEVFPMFGRVGIGGIDIDPQGDYLYVTNLSDRHIYKVEIDSDNNEDTKPTTADVERIPIPLICDPTKGETRPWAIKVFDSKLYVGMVCDAEQSQERSDLRGYVYAYDLKTKEWLTEPSVDFPLTYPKGSPATHVTPFQECGLWNPWNDDYSVWCNRKISDLPLNRSWYYSYPMPIISDLEFDVDGTLVIAIMDRSSFMIGNEDYDPEGQIFMVNISAAGDIIRALKFKDIFVLENNGTSGPHRGLLSNNRQGPGFGEFFNDNYRLPDSTLIHAELALGATAILPASQEMIYNAVDPISFSDLNFSAGLRWHNTSNGAFKKGLLAYQGTVLPSFAKSAGLGDIELQCEKLTNVTIGNYVWVDFDRDGVQDPCEPPARGINVTLIEKNGNEIATHSTDSLGRYFFRRSDYPQIQPNTKYDLVFATYGQYSPDLRVAVADIGLVFPTLSNREYFSYGDELDSDAIIDLYPPDHKYYTYPSMEITSPSEGMADLSFDFGLSFYDLSIKNIIINEKPLPYLKGEEITYQIVVYNFGGLPALDVESVCYLNKGMRFIPPSESLSSKQIPKNGYSRVVNDGWELIGDSILVANIDYLAQLDTDTLYLTLEVTDGYGPESWNLLTEVSNAFNILGESTATIDLDGLLDRNIDNNGGSLYRSPADNWLEGDGTATQINGIRETDQDNVDPAIANILDVALRIRPDTSFDHSIDSVKYLIEVENQGSFDLDSLIVSLFYSNSYCFEQTVNESSGWKTTDQSNIVQSSILDLSTLEMDTLCIYLSAIGGSSIADWTVEAEISDVFGLGEGSLVDFEIDSRINYDFSDNVGGMVDTPADDFLLGTGTASGPDSVAFTDQDNADKAYVLPTDMALLIDLDESFLNSSISLLDTVKYDITIFNQGKDVIGAVDFILYDQPCLEFIPALNPLFQEIPGGYTSTVNQIIESQENVVVSAFFRVLPGLTCQYINEAEILRFENDEGIDLSDQDIDSTPDRISSNDSVVINALGIIQLDSIDPCNNEIIYIDEDDHDIAPIPRYDLALKNEVISLPQKYGDTVCYLITIYNQGNMPVRDIDVINHISMGFHFDPSLNERWREESDGNLIYTHPSLLYGEDSVSFDLKLVVQASFPDSLAYLTVAEILTMYNSAREQNNDADLDSTPDGDSSNDIGGEVNTITDDHVFDDGLDSDMDNILDEDDHDPAIIEVFDLALEKDLLNPKIFRIGDDVEYRIIVKNEGSETARSFDIIDYLPQGLTFLSDKNPDWVLDTEGRPIYKSSIALRPGESDTAFLVLKVNLDIQFLEENTIMNVAEIIDHQNSMALFTSDFDSEPDSNPDNDEFENIVDGITRIEDDIDAVPILFELLDPKGTLYCDATGQLVSGGRINITRLEDNQMIVPMFSLDNNSDTLDGRNGVFQFAINTGQLLDDVDTFRINYVHPNGTILSSDCPPQPYFNAHGMGINGQVVLGDTNVVNGFLQDFSCNNNPYFLDFVLTDTTPLILGNNLPIRCGSINGTLCADQDTNALVDGGESLLSGRTVNLYHCNNTNTIFRTTTSNSSGLYEFNGLLDSCYRVQVVLDQTFVTYPNSTFDRNGLSIPLNINGGNSFLGTDFCFPFINCDSIFCQSNINVSVPDACSFELQPEIMLSGIIPRRDFIEFSYIDDNGQEIVSPIIPQEYIGRCIDVVSTTVFTCPFSPCISRVCFESKNAPRLSCVTDTISCTDLQVYQPPMLSEDCFEGTIQILADYNKTLCDNDSIVRHVTRTFQAVDQFGNKSNSCTSELFIKAVRLNDINTPKDTTIQCAISLSDVSNTFYGLPSFQGMALGVGYNDTCDLNVSFEDQIIMNTSCKKTVMRMWTIYRNHCGNLTSRRQPQTITLIDTLGPSINMQDTLRLFTSASACKGEARFDISNFIDDCQDALRIRANGPSSTADIMAGESLLLDTSWNQVIIQAFDHCHNLTTDTIAVHVTDNVAPLAVCLQVQAVVISQDDSVATIPITGLALANSDNCAKVTVDARKMNATCSNLDTIWNDSLTFCCSDYNQEVMAQIRVTDLFGNSATCMSTISVTADDSSFCQNSQASAFQLYGNVSNRQSYAQGDIQIMALMPDGMKEYGITNHLGDYSISLGDHMNGVVFTPYHNDNWLENVSTRDVISIQQHLIGIISLEGDDKIAADINGDDQISGIDIIYLRRMILGLINEAPNNTSWQFVQKDNDQPLKGATINMSNGRDEQLIKWTGIKTGDIFLDSAQGAIKSAQTRSLNHIYYYPEKNGDEIEYSFYMKDSLSLSGIQCEFSLPMNLSFNGMEQGILPIENGHYRYDEKSNSIKISYSSSVTHSLVSGQPLFKVKMNGILVHDEDYFSLKVNTISPELYTMSSDLRFSLRPDYEYTYPLLIHHNDPNPWNEETVITFQIPDDGLVELDIHSIDGRLMLSQSGYFTKGLNQVILNKKDISSNGVLVYKINFNQSSVTGKMIKLE